MRRLAALVGAVCCLASAAMANGPVLVMGDSIMAWNRTSGASVGDALERRLGREVENVSVPGARVSGRGLGFVLRIGGQYRPGDWEWVVLNGGANDLFRDCACRRCDTVLDRLIAPDGRRGEIATLAARLLGTGARVIYVGHYGPSGRGGPFDACADELTELDRRVARLAAIAPGIGFVDAGDVMSRRDTADYDADDIHPSPSGSAKIAGLVAAAIGAAEAR